MDKKDGDKKRAIAEYLPRPEMDVIDLTTNQHFWGVTKRMQERYTEKRNELKNTIIKEYEDRISQAERIISDVLNHTEEVRNAIQKENEKDKLVLTALKFLGCGCDLCLNHNNWKCPKIKEEEGK